MRWDLTQISDSAAMASGQCLHPFKRTRGLSRTGKQRRECVVCGKEFMEGAREWRRTADRAVQLLPYFRQGLRICAVSRLTGIHHDSVSRAFALIRKLMDRVNSNS